MCILSFKEKFIFLVGFLNYEVAKYELFVCLRDEEPVDKKK